MSRRTVVPDTSVIVAAHFQERHTKAAERLVNCIERQVVTAFAPQLLIGEFLKTAGEKCSRRSSSQAVDSETADSLVQLFFELRLTYVNSLELQSLVWEIIRNEPISPPDSWMLACAIHVDGDLWISHEHEDGFVSAARKRHPNRVFTLAHDAKNIP